MKGIEVLFLYLISHKVIKMNILYFRDPNLWVVKCRMGEEKATAISLMRKYIAYQFTDEVNK